MQIAFTLPMLNSGPKVNQNAVHRADRSASPHGRLARGRRGPLIAGHQRTEL
jgi:hypothetical protein